MEIRDILLFVRAGADNAALLASAGRLARDHGAMITGVCLCPEPEASVSDTYAIGAAGVTDVLEHRQRRIRAMVDPVETAYDRAVRSPGCSAGWIVSEPEEPPQFSALRARTFDLVLAGRPEAHEHPARERAETLVFAGGTPCLIVPREGGPGRFARIVVAWNGSVQAKRALDDALVFLQRAAAVQVVVLESEATSWVDETEAEALLGHLARHRVDAQIRRLAKPHADAGEVLLECCRDFEADLLVMGAFTHSRGAEAILGGATRTVLSRASLPVLLSH
jgi:nucleotide-binding universal stress UspA family protein